MDVLLSEPPSPNNPELRRPKEVEKSEVVKSEDRINDLQEMQPDV